MRELSSIVDDRLSSFLSNVLQVFSSPNLASLATIILAFHLRNSDTGMMKVEYLTW